MKQILLLTIICLVALSLVGIQQSYATMTAKLVLCNNDPIICPSSNFTLAYPIIPGIQATLHFGDCLDNQITKYQLSNHTWICATGGGGGISTINDDSSSAQYIVRGKLGNMTVTNSTGKMTLDTGWNIPTLSGVETFLGNPVTINNFKAGGQINLNGQTILNTGTITFPTSTGTLAETSQLRTYQNNTGSNLGTANGLGLYTSNSGDVLQFRSITCGAGMTCSNNATNTRINSTSLLAAVTSLNSDTSSSQTIAVVAGHTKITNAGATHTIDTDFKINSKTCGANSFITTLSNTTDSTCASPTGSGITSINSDTTAAQLIVRGKAGNMTVTNSTGKVSLDLGYRVVIIDGSKQFITKDMAFSGNVDFHDGGTNLDYFDNCNAVIRNTVNSFATTLCGGAVTANRTLNLPLTIGTDTLGALGMVQTWTGANTFNHGINSIMHSNTGLIVANPAFTQSYTIAGSAITANRTLNLPLTTGTDTLGALAMIQSWTGNNTEKFGAGGIIIRNPASTFTTKLEGNAVTANRTLNLPLTRQTETIAVVPQTAQNTNTTVQTTASATLVFTGKPLSITPQVTGNVRVHFTGYSSSGTLLDGCTLQMQEGTGTAPKAGVATSGTTVGVAITGTSATANANVPFTIIYPITGLALGTTVWFEPVFDAAIGGTCSLRNTMLVLTEY